MTRLFSPFDQGMFFTCSLYLILIQIKISTSIVFLNINRSLRKILTLMLLSFFNSLRTKPLPKGIIIAYTLVFTGILTANFFSVFPYNFPITSQASYVVFFSLGICVTFLIFSLSNSLKRFLIHLIPEGTPFALVRLLFLIELISNIIRPITLRVRLIANIVAGHLLIGLLFLLVSKVPLILAFYLGLNLVELFVAIIQSYIFTTIVALYFAEI